MNFVIRCGKQFAFTTLLLSFAICPFGFANERSANDGLSPLRSAYLGDEVWGRQRNSERQINEQLQKHFAHVLYLLASQSDSSLDKAVAILSKEYGPFDSATKKSVRSNLETRRTWQMHTLYEYAVRGKFPKNEGQSDSPAPIFVDSHGTHCAVGYLMHRSGHDSAVASISSTNNLVYISDVSTGELVDWIEFSGLTQDEAALIQPAYYPPETDVELDDFADANFSYSEHGLTVSELAMLRFSFDATSTVPSEILAEGITGVNSNGSEIPSNQNLFLTLGFGEYNGNCYACNYTPGFDNWMFLGGNAFSGPDTGDNAVVYRVDFRIRAPGEIIRSMTAATSHFFDFNFAAATGHILLQTDVHKADGSFVDRGTIEFEPEQPFSEIVPLHSCAQEELVVTSYVLSLAGSDFTAYWHGFENVPEIILGDTNRDGSVNLLDVQPFVTVLVSGDYQPEADVFNFLEDCVVDLLDVFQFVELLSGG